MRFSVIASFIFSTFISFNSISQAEITIPAKMYGYLGVSGGVGLAKLPFDIGFSLGGMRTSGKNNTYRGFIFRFDVMSYHETVITIPSNNFSSYSDASMNTGNNKLSVNYILRYFTDPQSTFFFDVEAGPLLCFSKGVISYKVKNLITLGFPVRQEDEFYKHTSFGISGSVGIGTYFSSRKNAFIKADISVSTPVTFIDDESLAYSNQQTTFTETQSSISFVSLTLGWTPFFE